MIHTETVPLAGDGAQRRDAYLARLAAGRGTGLIILHDMFGINPVFRELADDYARKGLCTVLPNLFWRLEPSGALSYDGGHEAAWARLRAFDTDAAVEDIRTTAAWLRSQAACTGKVAVLGFCFSGRLAVLAAARAGVDVAFSFYGLGVSQHADELKRVTCPLQLHYGLADEHVPRTEIDAVADAAAGHDRIAMHLYPGAEHSFCNKARPAYDKAAAELAGQRVDEALAALDS